MSSNVMAEDGMVIALERARAEIARLRDAIKQHRASRANRQATEKSLADADQELYAALGETAAA